MFKGKKGQALARDMGKRAKTFVPGGGAGMPGKAQPAAPTNGQSASKPEPARPDVEAIKVSSSERKHHDKIN